MFVIITRMSLNEQGEIENGRCIMADGRCTFYHLPSNIYHPTSSKQCDIKI